MLHRVVRFELIYDGDAEWVEGTLRQSYMTNVDCPLTEATRQQFPGGEIKRVLISDKSAEE